MDQTLRKRLEALTAAGRAQSLDFEGVAARVATDRFIALAAPDREACALYDEVMLRAIPHLDDATAHHIAAQLASCPAAPPATVAHLMARDCRSAARILALAPSLPAALLLDFAGDGDALTAAAVAARADIDRTVVGALSRRLEPEVLHALAANKDIAIDRGALISLTQRARLDIGLGRLLLARDEPSIDRLVLFLAAGSTARRRLLLDATRAFPARPTGSANGFDNVRVEALAIAETGDVSRFCACIARNMRVARVTIERLACDAGGEPLGLIFAAMGFAATESERPILAMRADLAAPFADPMSGVRLALQTPPSAAAAIVAALLPAKPKLAVGEYRRTRDGAQHQETETFTSGATARKTVNRA